jgi:hypothetical protein
MMERHSNRKAPNAAGTPVVRPDEPVAEPATPSPPASGPRPPAEDRPTVRHDQVSTASKTLRTSRRTSCFLNRCE